MKVERAERCTAGSGRRANSDTWSVRTNERTRRRRRRRRIYIIPIRSLEHETAAALLRRRACSPPKTRTGEISEERRRARMRMSPQIYVFVL